MDVVGPTREDMLREQRNIISSRFLDLEVEIGVLRVEHERTKAELDAVREEKVALAAELAELRGDTSARATRRGRR